MLKKLIKKGQKKTRNQEWVPTQHVWSIMGMSVVRGIFLIGGTNLRIVRISLSLMQFYPCCRLVPS
jgi:hypothetical protein